MPLLSAVCENFEFRLTVEPLAARYAAERGGDLELSAIRGSAEGTATTLEGLRTLDSRFHLTVARASHNPLLLRYISESRVDFMRRADAIWQSVDVAQLLPGEGAFARHHGPIAMAIEAGEAAEAQERMAAHLLDDQARFLALVERATRDDLDRASDSIAV